MPIQTHQKLIDAMMVSSNNQTYDYRAGKRHFVAWNIKNNPIVDLITSAAQIADRYWVRYDSRIGDDYVLGDHWIQIIRSAQALLSGDIGDLSAGTLDTLLKDMAELEGFTREFERKS